MLRFDSMYSWSAYTSAGLAESIQFSGQLAATTFTPVNVKYTSAPDCQHTMLPLNDEMAGVQYSAI